MMIKVSFRGASGGVIWYDPGTTDSRFMPAAIVMGIKMARRILCGLISLIRFVWFD